MRITACALLLLTATACSSSTRQAVLTADMPLHLEDHLDAATFTALAPPNGPTPDAPKSVEWRFDEPQPDWKATPQRHATLGPAMLSRTNEGLRVSLGPRTDQRTVRPNGTLAAGIHVDLPDWKRADWAEVVIRARAGPESPVASIGVRFDLLALPDQQRPPAECPSPYQLLGENSTVVADDRIHTYRLRAVPLSPTCTQAAGPGDVPLGHPWRQLALWFWTAGEPGSIDLLSVTVVPKGAVVPPATVEWRFDEPQPDWKPTPQPLGGNPTLQPAEVMPSRANDALRVTLTESSRRADKLLAAGIYIDLPGWRREEWAYIVVRARTTSVTTMAVGLNPGSNPTRGTFARTGGPTPIFSDGSVQTYQLRPDWLFEPTGPWLRIGLGFRASKPGSIDILSVSVVSIAALYAQDSHGSRSINVAGTYRRSLFTHAPGRIEYHVRVPDGGRLQAAISVLTAHVPVEFRITARPARGEATTLLNETYADPEQWADRAVDLSGFAGQTITLALETHAATAGTVAFWGAPTVSGAGRTDKPNVILYVIDGGGADYMSVYGYNRRTTPNLEKLAAEGAVFERAYSNSSWTRPSTASFMTSLQETVLGFDEVPAQAVTMAERFHGAGYQTAVFSANPNATTRTGLQRGADLLQAAGVVADASSSAKLHEAFWNWRQTYPGQPYWVHFQTTDVHAITNGSSLAIRDGDPVPPFAGLFVSPEDVARLRAWGALVGAGGGGSRSSAFETGAVSRSSFFTLLQGLYDQQMAHNDFQLGRLIDRLKASGEWSNTLLIVSADHGLNQGLGTDMTERLDTIPPHWTRSTLRSTVSHVPLVIAWPGHIAGGQRFTDPVSLIDLLPTVLDMAGLPPNEVMQGQSLAPLLRGRPGWTPRPVIMDETLGSWEEPLNSLSVIDGRWGATWTVGWPLKDPDYASQPWPVLLFDLWADPLAVSPVNEAHPELVQKYTKFLADTRRDHQALAKQFKPGPKVTLTPEQLERLRSLGYIR